MLFGLDKLSVLFFASSSTSRHGQGCFQGCSCSCVNQRLKNVVVKDVGCASTRRRNSSDTTIGKTRLPALESSRSHQNENRASRTMVSKMDGRDREGNVDKNPSSSSSQRTPLSKQEELKSSLSDLCRLLGATLSNEEPIRLSDIGPPSKSGRVDNDKCDEGDGSSDFESHRGVIVTSNIRSGDIVLSIPIESCFCDDTVPAWFEAWAEDTSFSSTNEEDILTDSNYWATRLAASLLDVHMKHAVEEHDNEEEKDGSKRSQDQDPSLKYHTTIPLPSPSLECGHSIWLRMLPNPLELSATLPVHWPEEIVSRARSCALELACDSAYFARAEAVRTLVESLEFVLSSADSDMENNNESEDEEKRDNKSSSRSGEPNYLSNSNLLANSLRRLLLQRRSLHSGSSFGRLNVDADSFDDNNITDRRDLEQLCHDMLDVVQTRTCRVKHDDGFGMPFRILAPVFDFINHASFGEANADFHLTEDNALVVTAKRDIRNGEELLIDYGASARPGWRCLASYGFLPQAITSSSHDQNRSTNKNDNQQERESKNEGEKGSDIDQSVEYEEDTAEIFMYGKRYEVTPTTIPAEMVEAATIAMHDEYTQENPNVADAFTVSKFSTALALFRIAQRMSDAAYDMVLMNDDLWDDGDDDDYDMGVEPDDEKEDDPMANHQPDVQRLVAESLAASLRWSQHRVLLECAKGLRAYASTKLDTPDPI